MSGNAVPSGALDLEKELSCSICTDILFQPLTLLDCLHTFCGSCLKEWFSWQATAAVEQRNPHPYTCPSCRATVRAARPNANVTTLLEMYTQANPSKGKSEQEKEEMRLHYKPGDDVLLPVVFPEGSDNDSEDERLLDHVRELSVADLDPAVAANRRNDPARRERRARDGNSPRDRDIRRREVADRARQRQEIVDRNVSHQPSLRSLLSASGDDSAEIQQEILTSILSSGMLDDIDIDNLTAEQEEELTERIAEAYRRRHRDIHRARSDAFQGRTVTPDRAQPAAEQTTRTSRPHLIEQWTQDTTRRAPSSSTQNRRDSSNTQSAAAVPNSSGPGRRDSSIMQAATAVPNSATPTGRDSSNVQAAAARASNSPPPSRRDSSNMQSTTGALTSTPVRAALDTTLGADHQVRASSEYRSNTDSALAQRSPRLNANPIQHNTQRRSTDTQRHAAANQYRSSSNPSSTPQLLPYPDRVLSPPASDLIVAQLPPQQRQEDSQFAVHSAIAIPHVNCDRCQRPTIQHNLHYHCSKCSGGDFDLCLQCYRAGAGCNNWWGFGYSALTRHERNAPEGGWPADYERPHVLTARRYQRHADFDRRIHDLATWKPLQEGAFCERCFRLANDRYWHCVTCQEGAWGFCNQCVQQGNHCTHPLLPTAWTEHASTSWSVSLPHIKSGSMAFVPQTQNCAICHQDIQRQDTYLHCSSCNNGAYDMCVRCHHALVSTGKIGAPAEARLCLQGHGMALVQFQTASQEIEQRVVLADPSPANGSRCIALWSWFPAEGVDDELALPKYAEVRDVKQMNEDYSVGVYAGDIGLFPSNHTRPL